MKRLTVVYEVPDTYDVSRITGTGDREVVKCSWSDAMRERDEARQQLAEVQAENQRLGADNDELLQQIDDAGDGDTWRAACLRVTAELEISQQRLSQAEILLQRSKLAVLEADSDLSAFAAGRRIDKDAAERVSWMCRQVYSDIVKWLLNHVGDSNKMMG